MSFRSIVRAPGYFGVLLASGLSVASPAQAQEAVTPSFNIDSVTTGGFGEKVCIFNQTNHDSIITSLEVNMGNEIVVGSFTLQFKNGAKMILPAIIKDNYPKAIIQAKNEKMALEISTAPETPMIPYIARSYKQLCASTGQTPEP